MTASRVAVVAAILAVITWCLKGVAIGVAGGLDESPLEAPLFVIGMLLLTIALAAFGVAATAGRPAWLRALAVVGAIVVGVLATILIQDAVKAILPDSTDWVQEEAGLWIASFLVAGLIVGVLRRRALRPPASST